MAQRDKSLGFERGKVVRPDWKNHRFGARRAAVGFLSGPPQVTLSGGSSFLAGVPGAEQLTINLSDKLTSRSQT